MTNIIAAFIYISAIMIIVHYVFGKPITAIAATSGIMVFVLGYSAKATLGEIFSGIAINITPPFQIGEKIEINDIFGEVKDMNWRSITILTQDGNHIIVPNSNISKSEIKNYSRPSSDSRVDIEIMLDYATTSGELLKILRKTLSEFDRAFTPEVFIKSYEPYGIQYLLRFWISDYTPGYAYTVKNVLHYNILTYHRNPFGYNKRDAMSRKLYRPLVNLEHRLEILEKVDLFENLSEDNMAHIAEHMEQHHYGPPQKIIKENMPGDSMFIMYRGHATVTKQVGTDLLDIASLNVGDYFGEMALLTGEKRTATISAKEDTIVFEISKAVLKPIFEKEEQVVTDIAIAMTSRKEQLEEKTSAAEAKQGKQKEKDSLSSKLKERILDFFFTDEEEQN